MIHGDIISTAFLSRGRLILPSSLVEWHFQMQSSSAYEVSTSNYPWFEKKKEWQKEIKKMLQNDFKLEVEALISKDISYVTEVYVPERLKKKDWLD